MEDWIQTIIILLVIGGSAIGPILKKLIEAATPKDQRKTAGTTPPSPRDGDTESPPKLEPPRPTRRPAQSRTVQRATPPSEDIPQAVPIPPPPPLRVVTVGREAPEPTSRPTVDDAPRRRASLPSERPTQPTARKTTRPQPLASAGERLGHVESIVEQTGGADERAAEQRLRRVSSTLEETGERIHEGIDEHLGHVESTAYAREAQTPRRARIPGLGRATPQAMRQAIVLVEILGPPIALRPPEPRD